MENFTQIKYGQTVMPVPEGVSNIEEIKEGLATFFPEVHNATHTIEDGVLEFKVQANKKG